MTVTWYPATGNAEVLADDSLPAGPGGKHCLDVWPDHAQMVQSVARVRATRITNYGRENLSVTRHVRTRVEFDSVDDCSAYRDDLMEKLKGAGSLEVMYDGGTYRTMHNAVVTGISFAERYGVSTVIEFTFIGSHISGGAYN